VQRPGDRVQQDVEIEGKIFPVIIGALGKINNGLDKNIQLLLRRLSTVELQKFIIMSTAHINLKVLGYIGLIFCCDLD
jgi:hypothetical protein